MCDFLLELIQNIDWMCNSIKQAVHNILKAVLMFCMKRWHRDEMMSENFSDAGVNYCCSFEILPDIASLVCEK